MDNINEVFDRLRKDIADSLNQAMEETKLMVRDDSIKDAPIKSGDLIASAKTSKKKKYKLGERFSFEVSFGDSDDEYGVGYAQLQHEQFPKKKIKGKIKYLSSNLEKSKTYLQINYEKNMNKK